MHKYEFKRQNLPVHEKNKSWGIWVNLGLLNSVLKFMAHIKRSAPKKAFFSQCGFYPYISTEKAIKRDF